MTTSARALRRPALGAAAIIVGYACVVGLISANAGGDDLGPPEAISRPVWLAVLLMLPAAIAVIGAWRSSRPLLIAAGTLCVAQSYLAFSLVTIPFIIPAILLLSLAGVSGGVSVPRRAILGAIAVVALGVGAWVAVFALTETVCWVARVGADGASVYSRIPVSDSLTVGIGEVASGCDGGVASIDGLALAGILAIGAIAVAEVSSRRARDLSGTSSSSEVMA
jgi:hypothetical protein